MKTKNALTLCLEENCNVYHVRLEIVFFLITPYKTVLETKFAPDEFISGCTLTVMNLAFMFIFWRK